MMIKDRADTPPIETSLLQPLKKRWYLKFWMCYVLTQIAKKPKKVIVTQILWLLFLALVNLIEAGIIKTHIQKHTHTNVE